MTTLPITYKSAVLQNGIVKLINKNFPQNLSNEEIVIKIDFMGLCRADVKEITGSRDIPEDRGALFGHELVGEIAYAGTETGFNLGEKVTFNPNITPNRTTGFAEYFFIHGDKETLKKAVIRIPENITFETLWEPEPFACIVHSVRKLLELNKLKDLKDKKVAIIGLGNSAIMFGMFMKHLGGEIKLFNRGDMRIDFVKKQNLFIKEELEKLDNVQSFTSIFDIVIVVPTKIDSNILHYTHTLVKNQGIIHLYGGTRKQEVYLSSNIDIDVIRRNESKQRFNYNQKLITITGAYGCNSIDYEECFQLFNNQNSVFSIDKLISKEISLDDFPNLIMSMAKNETDYPGKVIIKNN